MRDYFDAVWWFSLTNRYTGDFTEGFVLSWVLIFLMVAICHQFFLNGVCLGPMFVVCCVSLQGKWGLVVRWRSSWSRSRPVLAIQQRAVAVFLMGWAVSGKSIDVYACNATMATASNQMILLMAGRTMDAYAIFAQCFAGHLLQSMLGWLQRICVVARCQVYYSR